MYAVMNFGVFVCSTCAGIHREINNKVKGLSMCTFNEAELKNLTQNGNLVSKLKYHSPTCNRTNKVFLWQNGKLTETKSQIRKIHSN